jgi:hypothetical protein
VTERPVAGRLAVVDEADRVLVVLEDDPSDWICAFAKGGDFPAGRWAQDMARTYNARLGACQRPGGAPGAAEPWMPGSARG